MTARSSVGSPHTLSPADRGLPVSALARGFIARGLAERHHTTVHAAIERIQADVQKLKSLIA